MKLNIIAFACLITAPALAGEVDFSTVLTDADGAQIIDCPAADCPGKPPLTLGKIAMRALTASFPDEQSLSGDEKFKRAALALRVYKAAMVSLSAEDVVLIKKLIAKGYGPLVVLKTWSLLDPSTEK